MSRFVPGNDDPYALPTVRGKPRTLHPRLDPDNERDRRRWRARIEKQAKPLCVSLWSGAGGLDLGLEQAGYDVVVAADHDEWACQTHGHNSNALVFCRDLHDTDSTRRFLRNLELPPIDLVAGGFPCQPYSRAGSSMIRFLVEQDRRPEVDPRTHAWKSFVAAVDELRPRRALAENVPDLYRFDDGQLLREIVRSLEAIGYEVDFRILTARVFGVPQFRERLIVQAALPGATISWPEAPDDVDDSLWLAIGDLPEIDPGHQEELMRFPGTYHPPAWAGSADVRPDLAETWLIDHTCRDVRKDDLEAFRVLEPGGTYLDLPEELRRYNDDHFTDKYKRLEWEKPSRTITAHIARDGYWYIHPEQHRTLSIREAARVQTFPDEFVFAGFPSNRYQQIGNAVPPLLARHIGTSMNDSISNKSGEPAPLPAAAACIRDVVLKDEVVSSDWQLLVAEIVFKGRAGEDRLQAFLKKFPIPESAARIRATKSGHERVARTVGRALSRKCDGAIPDSVSEAKAIFDISESSARLIVAMRHGGEVPRNQATVRMAERVSGISRAGSLNGVGQVALARLSNFGDDPASNRVLVELARNICTNERPGCRQCPVSQNCSYAAAAPGDVVDDLPAAVA